MELVEIGQRVGLVMQGIGVIKWGFKMNIKSNFIFRLINILFISFLFSCKLCREPFKRNPNLELLLKNEWDSFFNPVWAPNGKDIYYLKAHEERLPTPAAALAKGGEL